MQCIEQVSEGKMPIIAVGGVTTWQEFLLLLIDGASLVQGYTAFIYEGPAWARKVLQEATRFCKSQALSSIHAIQGRKDLEEKLLS